MDAKQEALGVPYGTASNKLRKALLFDAIGRLGERTCYRCEKPIETIEEFSIEHKNAWMRADDKVAAFYAMNNIAYSHLHCNSQAGRRSQYRAVPHGAASTYERHGCRCRPCTDAAVGKVRKHRAKSRATIAL